MINIYSQEEIGKIRESCVIVAKALRMIENFIEEGISTKELDSLIEKQILDYNAKPAFKGYRGFPCASCISIDCEVVHGIPSTKRRLKSMEIVSIDIGVEKDGYFGDGAWSYAVGKIEKSKQLLLTTTKKALDFAIEQANTKNRISNISHVIQQTCELQGFSVVRDLVGHGIGRKLHEEPQVPNFVNEEKENPRIENGMVFAIEPMVNMGTYKVNTLNDSWTVITQDKQPSAHFEHTVAIENGFAQVLTESN